MRVTDCPSSNQQQTCQYEPATHQGSQAPDGRLPVRAYPFHPQNADALLAASEQITPRAIWGRDADGTKPSLVSSLFWPNPGLRPGQLSGRLIRGGSFGGGARRDADDQQRPGDIPLSDLVTPKLPAGSVHRRPEGKSRAADPRLRPSSKRRTTREIVRHPPGRRAPRRTEPGGHHARMLRRASQPPRDASR